MEFPNKPETRETPQLHSPPNEEPSFVPEEDIPLDGPDPEGEKMIEELAPGTGQPLPPGT